jgi:Na+/H+ antiporter NhaD/arsenite permease-like protein
LVLGAINIVVASNAGGAWSPFGDITTLMVWSANKSEFTEFLYLFPSAFMGWFITAILLSIFIPKSDPFLSNNIEKVSIKKGGKFIIFLGVVTITMAIVFHHILKLPVFWGMMMGLAIINLYSSYLHKVYNEQIHIYKRMSEVHDDTLLFFFGLLSAVGGLSHMGYIDFITDFYNQFNPYTVNIIVGLLSAVIDNVPIMFAILNTDPALQQSQWLLLTLTVGIGGSLISFGSAAGIGVMGVLSGIYTFSSHLRYIWIIFIGYLVSVLVFWIQFELFI